MEVRMSPLDTLAEIFGVTSPNGAREITLSCARCLSQITVSQQSWGARVVFVCAGGCTEDDVIGALAEIEPKFADWWLNGGLTDDGRGIERTSKDAGTSQERPSDARGGALGIDDGDSDNGPLETQMPRQGERPDEASVSNEEKNENDPEDSGPHLNGQVSEVFRWRLMLHDRAKADIEHSLKVNPLLPQLITDYGDDDFLPTVQKHSALLKAPAGLSHTEVDEEVWAIAVGLRKHYAPRLEMPAVQNVRVSTVDVEDAEEAEHSNAEYLSRSAILERTYYTHHASLHVGGKHDGKTTCCKTEALMFASGGGEIWGRKAEGTPVIYAASEDEYPSVRMDLLHMGWNPGVPLRMLRIKDKADRDFVLEDIAKAALQVGAYIVYLDMLFDFTQISDEISYTDTREQCGKVVQLAVAINGHVKATHHSPKWMPDAAKAAKAALGSQGLAARFSPIVLSKCWIEPMYDPQGTLVRPGLYTIESTMTRDPRGAALPVTVVERYENGWAKSGGEFKSAMKWPIYCQRILDLFEMSEPGKRFTVNAVSKTLNIPHPETQNAMYNMTEDSGNPRPNLERMKKIMGQGGGFTYGLIGHNTLNAAFLRAKNGNDG